MPDNTLSQNEIDALFSELNRGPETEASEASERFRSVRPYDFRHPSKLSKEQLRTLQMIFETFARLASTNLSGTLRVQTQMTLVSVEQTVFDDYVRALAAKTLLNLASIEPLPGTFVFEYDLGTALVMVDRLLGGTGKAVQGDHDITEIEEVLLQSVAQVFLSAFGEAWEHLSQLRPGLQRLEYSPRFLQIAPLNEPVVLLLFDLRVGDRQASMSMCIPYSVIEPIASDLNVQTLFMAPQGGGSDDEGGNDAHLQRVAIPLVAELGTTSLPLATVNGLQVGDVLRLDGLASDPLIVSVNKRPTFVARPGLARQGLAIQILGVLHDGEVPRR